MESVDSRREAKLNYSKLQGEACSTMEELEILVGRGRKEVEYREKLNI